MAKKTAMKQLLEVLETAKIKNPKCEKVWGLEIAILNIGLLLVEEKEQIQSAFESGMVKNNSSNRYVSDIEAEKYYQTTFKND